MRGLRTVLLCCIAALLCLTIAGAADDSRSYLFTLSIDGQETKTAQPGDIVTVAFHLYRTDSDAAAPMYGMQNEICYDTAFFEPVEGSTLLSQGVRTTDIAGHDGTRRVYMNFLSLSGGELWPAERLVGSFQLRLIGTEGTTAITNENVLVSTADGMDAYDAAVQDLTVTVGQTHTDASAASLPAGLPSRRPVGLWIFAVLAAAALALYGCKKWGRK